MFNKDDMKTYKPTTVTRTIIHNKRMAPKGHVFFVCKHTIYWSANKTKTYTLAQLVNTKGLSNEDEAKIKEALISQMNHKLESI